MSRVFLCPLVMTILLFCNCSAVIDIAPIQQIDPSAAVGNPCADIRNGQFVCLDCSTLAFCLQEGGDWITFEYEKCRTEISLFCDEEAMGCTLQRECTTPSRGIKFECQNPGTYPDPYDCRLYHKCNSFNEDTRYSCPSGKAYSVADKDCTLNAANSNTCKQVQYDCQKVGQMGSWPGDANIYYVCHVKSSNGKLVFYPVLYRCQEGKVFDGQQCTSSSELSTVSFEENTRSTERTTVSSGKCIEGALTPNSNDCRGYYSCKNGKLVANQCPGNTHFNSNNMRCDIGGC